MTQAFVCESNRGFKVVVSKKMYGDLNPENMVIVADGLTRDQAIKQRIDADLRLGVIPAWHPQKFA